MALEHIMVLLATGVGVGFASGFLGLGGAFIMTPIQYMVFTDMGISVDTAIKLAFGTNLLVILPTAASGAWRHHREGLVRWKAAIVMGVCGMLFAFGGATLAAHLPGLPLKISYGIISILSGVRMLTAKQPRSTPEPVENVRILIAWAIPLSILIGLFGFGGAIVMVPVMVLALKFKMHNAIATSLAVMIFTSVGGVIGYIINGIGVPDLPAHSIGYVNLTSWILLTVTSVGMAQVGAMASQKIPARHLRLIFIVVMFYMGLKMIGVFDWFGWPL